MDSLWRLYDILDRMDLKPPLLIYDADCPLCVRFKQSLERWDSEQRITYVSLSAENVFTQFPQLDPAACAARVHYLREDGAILTGGEVITELLKHYPGVSKIAWLLETDVGKKTVEFFYQQVEAARARLKAQDEDCGSCRK